MKKDIVLSENKMTYLIKYFKYFKYKILSFKIFNDKLHGIFYLSSKMQITKYSKVIKYVF